MILMCVYRLSVLIVRKLCIFFALCFSVFLYLFIVMSYLLPFCVYFVYDFYTNNN